MPPGRAAAHVPMPPAPRRAARRCRRCDAQLSVTLPSSMSSIAHSAPQPDTTLRSDKLELRAAICGVGMGPAMEIKRPSHRRPRGYAAMARSPLEQRQGRGGGGGGPGRWGWRLGFRPSPLGRGTRADILALGMEIKKRMNKIGAKEMMRKEIKIYVYWEERKVPENVKHFGKN